MGLFDLPFSQTTETTGGTGAYKGQGLFGLGKFLEGIGNAYWNRDETVHETIKRLTDSLVVKLDDSLAEAVTEFLSSEWTKASAKADAEACMNNHFEEYREEYLPTIYGNMCANGIYNSTAAQMLANDAYARTVRKTCELVLESIKAYAGIQQGFGQVANALLGTATNATVVDDKTVEENKKPDIGQFGEDAAIMLTAFLLLSAFLSPSEGGSSSTSIWDALPGL